VKREGTEILIIVFQDHIAHGFIINHDSNYFFITLIINSFFFLLLLFF